VVLLTNRPLDSGDRFMALRDGRDGTLTRVAEQPAESVVGRARAKLAQHLRCNEAELCSFLGDVQFRIGKLQGELEEQASELMARVGLRTDANAVREGISLVRSWVTAGRRKLSVQEIRTEIEQAGLRAETPAATLLVQSLDRDPFPATATVALDWVDLFAGGEARARRQLLDHRQWNERLRPELQAAVSKIKSNGFRKVRVQGTMRLPTWFVTGVELGETAGFTVETTQRNEVWSSEGDSTSVVLASGSDTSLGSGCDLALGVSIAADLSAEALEYARGALPSVGRFVAISPVNRPHRTAIRNPQEARGYAVSIRDKVRKLATEIRPHRVHLFLAMPAGLALLLGHLWDRMPETQVYEDQGPGRGYAPSYLIRN